MSDEIRTVNSTVVLSNKWITVRDDEIEYPDGSRSTYAVVEKPNFALVVPFTGDGYWIVSQYRYPIKRRTWEFPQGAWPSGHSGTSEELARAELAEETGLRAGSLTQLGTLYASVGYCAQTYDLYLATDLSEGEPDREHSESDMVHKHVSVAELWAMIAAGEFPDSHSMAALGLLASRA